MATALLTLPACQYAEGKVQPPGSKSLANRVLPLAAIAQGETVLRNLPDGEDVTLMRGALQTLGARCSDLDSTTLRFHGPSGPWEKGSTALPSVKTTSLFLGNSGTSTRILTALLCGGQGQFVVDGIERMRERPIGDLVDALRPLCGNRSHIEYAHQSGFPPLLLKANGLQGGKTFIKGDISSQFVTGLLLALPLCQESVEVEVRGTLVSAPYVAMTLAVMKAFGVQIENEGFSRFRLLSPAGYQSPGEYLIEPDASSASYFLAAGAISRGNVKVTGLGKQSLQGEAQFATVLERMGAVVEWQPDSIAVTGLRKPLEGVDVDMDQMSDTGMTLALVACFAKGPTKIRNIGNWRVKETDRIAAMATELRKIGAQVEEGSDSLVIHPPSVFQSARIGTYHDHRMAMCFSLACLGGVSITLENPECVQKTYPGYYRALNSILRTGKDVTTPPPQFLFA